jgi:hypothetical protein
MTLIMSNVRNIGINEEKHQAKSLQLSEQGWGVRLLTSKYSAYGRLWVQNGGLGVWWWHRKAVVMSKMFAYDRGYLVLGQEWVYLICLF